MTRAICNGAAADLDIVVRLDPAAFRHRVVEAVESSQRVVALAGTGRQGDRTELLAALADGLSGRISFLGTAVGGSIASMTPECPPLGLYEREIAEQWGVRPLGHPWLKPVRGLPPLIAEGGPGADLPWDDLFRLEGEEVHEVAVGPVHAGVIEPGHFRFQCHGEEVLFLEIALGYQHRGAERAFLGCPEPRRMAIAETVCGDTSIGHATAYCQIREALAGATVPPRAEVLRAIALELERVANHVGDLGALAGDVGYLPAAAYFGRLRGDFLNLTAVLCGSRFGRGLVRPGGVAYDANLQDVIEIKKRLRVAYRDLESAAELLFGEASVLARFCETGKLWRSTAQELGLVGPAGRACGIERDVRFEFPTGAYRYRQIPVATWHSGDVFARAHVRYLEIKRSVAFIQDQLDGLPAGPARVEMGPAPPGRLAISLVEGWRGEICHVAVSGESGGFHAYKIVDPSFHNWAGLAMAMRGQPISDFPLCNKSFNLSYCGHDL